MVKKNDMLMALGWASSRKKSRKKIASGNKKVSVKKKNTVKKKKTHVGYAI